MPDRGMNIVSRLVDVIGYATKEVDEETGVVTHTLTLKGSKYLEAGTRNGYLPDKIPLTYEALNDAMQKAIDKIAENGGEVIDTEINPFKDKEEAADFKGTMKEIKVYAKAIFNASETGRDDYGEIVAKYLGVGQNVKDCTPQQIDQMILILNELKDYVTEHEIAVE